ncbi:MAG: DUF721 domain-containing protein [Alphaproteobacteria bacterium]|nr:DUF721 domain-containing protein [Alphaproteobacteria bacterium]MCW5741915.1 DUF721 domain-containing protein [Alphaproteobacteria bacterium]
MSEDDPQPEITLDRRGRFRRLGASVPGLIRPLAKARGTALASLLAEWPLIVGDELARVSLPDRLTGTTLRLLVVPSAALVMQHDAPRIVARINAYYGRPAVGRISLVQGPLPAAAPPRRPARPALAADRQAALRAATEGIDDDRLKAALERLGRAILARDKG